MKIKLRSKLIILFIGIAMVPLFTVMIVTLARLQNIQRDNAVNLEKQIAESAAQEIADFIILQFATLDNIDAIYPEFSLVGTEIQDTILERILFTNDNFTDITIIDANGYEVNRKNRLLIIAPEDFVNRSESIEFSAVRNLGRYFGPLFLERGRPSFVIGKSILDVREEFQGAVFAKIDARVMQDVVKRISAIGEEGRAYIVNQDGVVIAHPDLSQVLAEKNFSFIPAVRELLDKKTGVSLRDVYQNELGEEVLGTGLPISLFFEDTSGSALETQWFVIAEQPAHVAFAQVRQITRFTLIALFTVMLIAGIVALLFARGIVAPIEKVHYASQQFARGRLRYRVVVKTNDEIEDLANGFNKMASTLSKSISDLKKERRIITAEKNKLSRVLEGMTDAVIAVDLNRNIIIFNQAAVSMIGISEYQVLGKPIDSVVKFSDGSKEIPVSQYCPIKSEGALGVTFSKNSLQMHGSGTRERYINLMAGQIKEGRSINLGCIITLHDVTKERLIEKMKSEFVSIAAHQLRTPLSVVKWALTLLIEESNFKKITHDQQDMIRKAYLSNERMITLVSDLLDAARIEEGKFVFKLALSDIQKVIESALDLHAEEIKKKNLELIFIKPKKRLPKIQMDATSIKLAIENLIENSQKYTLPGGRIEISLRGTNFGIEIYVRDTGIAIPKDDQERVFGKFFRAKNAVALETEGSGLGLFIAKNIIEAHGGKIWFESEKGKGSTFYFALPLRPL